MAEVTEQTTGPSRTAHPPTHRQPFGNEAGFGRIVWAMISVVAEAVLGAVFSAIFPKTGVTFGVSTAIYFVSLGGILLLAAWAGYRYIWDPLGMMREARRVGDKSLTSLLNFLPTLEEKLTVGMWDVASDHDIRRHPKTDESIYWIDLADARSLAKSFSRRIVRTYDVVTGRSDDVQLVAIIALILGLIGGAAVLFGNSTESGVTALLTVLVLVLEGVLIVANLYQPSPLYSLKTWKEEIKALYYRDDAEVEKKLLEWAKDSLKKNPLPQ